MKKVFFLSFATLWSIAAAQPAPPEFRAGVAEKPNYRTLHMRTRLGSFKLINGEGRVRFSFKGSVMINARNAKIDLTGNVRKELSRKDRDVYFGSGTMTVTGSWRSIQWFGKDLSQFMWFGTGIARITGEFDDKLETGIYWYNDPADFNYWFANSAFNVILPPYEEPKVTPRQRKE